MPAKIKSAILETVFALSQSQSPPLSHREIALKTNLSQSTVTNYLHDRKLLAEVASTPSFLAIKKGISEQFYRAAALFTTLAVEPDRLDKMNSYQLTGMAGVAHQNARLAGGESTQNIGIAAVVAQATRERMKGKE